ncbi:tetratricopeptide repeat protein [Gracilimonas sp. Q87]|uniref:tetratricopeptide repeat protein n=1 Tax=Gracilimonas sp. Q87 TaxID=3384766 RepID=UPI003983EDE9
MMKPSPSLKIFDILKRNLIYIALLLILSAFTNDEARQANSAFDKGNYEEAEELYKAAIEVSPDNYKLYFNLGNAQAKQGKVEEAIESFMEFRSLAESPQDKSMAEYNIGTLLAEDQKWKPAATHFKNALKLNSSDLDAKHNYERALAEMQNEEDEGGDEQNQEKQQPPEPSEYAIAMKKQAEKLVAEQRYQDAYNLMQRALEADDTVRAFNDFIERIRNVSEINSN